MRCTEPVARPWPAARAGAAAARMPPRPAWRRARLLALCCLLALPARAGAGEEADFEAPADDAPVLKVTPAVVREGVLAGAALPQLRKLHQRLRALQEGRVDRVTILQIGDSHTAADHFSGRLRALFQADFGSAGRGQLAPGVPTVYWRPSQVRAEQSGRWEAFTSNKVGFAPLAYGLSGYIVRGKEQGNTVTLQATQDEARFASVVIGSYRKPGGGSFDVLVDGALVATIATGGPTGYVRDRVAVPSGQGQQLQVRLRGDGEVDLGEWGLYRAQPGVEFVSHGFVGAQVTIMQRWSEAIVAQQLAELDPALILLAFGTNEGYAAKGSLHAYARHLEDRIATLRKLAPNAALVLVAAPDANRLPKFCGGAPEAKACRPLSAAESDSYETLLARQDKDLCRWHTPASYTVIRAAQRQAGARLGAYWWDWAGEQGGFCAASTWHDQGLVQKDRIHLKREGARRSADKLYALLLRGYPFR